MLKNKTSQPAAVSRWTIAVIIALTVTAFVVAFTYVWDSDVLWHLAAGDWMLRHHAILGTDPFSIDPDPVWVNVHWLFQLKVASLYAIGGFGILSAMKAVLCAGVLFAFAFGLRRHVWAPLLGLCGLAILVTIAGRVRVRPEAFTLLYLMVTILLVDSVRRGGKAKVLWWMVPIMMLWANMHGLYILGLGIIWSAVIGASCDRLLGRLLPASGRAERLLPLGTPGNPPPSGGKPRLEKSLTGNLLTQQAIVPLIAATLACLINPWPVETVLQPLLLWTRVSGQNAYYSYVVTEFAPTWQGLGHHYGLLSLLGTTIVAMAINVRRVPVAHVLWLAAFGGLAMLAVRNIALVGPVCGFLLAWHGQEVIAHLRRDSLGVGRIGAVLTAVVLLMAAAMCVGYATEYTYRREGVSFKFGPGLLASEYPIQSAKFMRDLPSRGDMFVNDFGDAGAYLYYCSDGLSQPKRLMYMDARLEAHDLARFINQQHIHSQLQDPLQAQQVKLPPSVRFVIVRQSAAPALSAMAQAPRFRLVYIDPVSACFADTKWEIQNGRDPLPAGLPNFSQYDKPLSSDNHVGEVPTVRRHWYRQNPISLNYRLGQMLTAIGAYGKGDARGTAPLTRYRCNLMAIRYLTAAAEEEQGTPAYLLDRKAMTNDLGLLAKAYQQRAFQEYDLAGASLPVEINTARALRLYRQIDLSKLDSDEMVQFGVEHIRTLLLASQYDQADKAIKAFEVNLPKAIQIQGRCTEEANVILRQLEMSQVKAADLLAGKDLTRRVQALTNKDVGLIDQAVTELQAAAELAPAEQLLLGDLLLRKGLTEDARKVYANVPAGAVDTWKLDLRRALCDWVDGRLFAALDALTALAKSSSQPLVNYYLATLLVEIGDYDSARKALPATPPADEPFAKLFDRLRGQVELLLAK